MADEKKIINREELKHEDRLKLINETLDLSDRGENPDFQLSGNTEPKKEEFKHPFVISYGKEGDEPKPGEDGGDGGGPSGDKGGEAGDDPPAPDAGAKLKGDIYNSLSEADPEFKAKYKNLDEYMEATTGKKPGASSEPGASDPPPAKSTPSPVLTGEEREQVILSKAYQFFSQDAGVQELLQKIGMSKVPTTLDDWAEMHKLDKEKNGSEFLSGQVTTLFNKYKGSVSERLEKVEETMASRDDKFFNASKDFVDRTEKYAKEIYKGITAKDAEPLKAKMDTFFKEAIRFDNNKPVHPEYFTSENGIPIPNGKAIYSDFISENTALFSGYYKLGAGKDKGGSKSLKQQLSEQTKNNGKSIKTLGNQGHNSGSTKQVFIDSRKDRENLSSKERKRILEVLDEEIKNT